MFNKTIKKGVILILFGIILLSPVILADTLVGNVGVSISVKGGIVCSDSGTNWTDYSQTPPKTIFTTGQEGNCYYEAGLDLTGRSNPLCCPNGYSCVAAVASDPSNPPIDSNGNRIYYCTPDVRMYCSQFNKDKEDCENTTWKVANRSILAVNGSCGYDEDIFHPASNPARSCLNVYDCYCKWQSGDCNAIQTNRTDCDSPISIPEEVENGRCVWKLIRWDDRCEDEGYIDAAWEGNPEGTNPPQECALLAGKKQVRSKIIDCESIVKMDFFDSYNFVITTFILVGIYSFVFFKMKIKKNEMKKESHKI